MSLFEKIEVKNTPAGTKHIASIKVHDNGIYTITWQCSKNYRSINSTHAVLNLIMKNNIYSPIDISEKHYYIYLAGLELLRRKHNINYVFDIEGSGEIYW
jgi:hypothetical protein